MKCTYIYDDDSKCDGDQFGGYEFCIEHYKSAIAKTKAMDDTRDREALYDEALKSIPPVVTSLEQIRDVLGIAIPHLIFGNMSPKIVDALTRACLAQARILEITEIDQKLKQLEKLASNDMRYTTALSDE